MNQNEKLILNKIFRHCCLLSLLLLIQFKLRILLLQHLTQLIFFFASSLCITVQWWILAVALICNDLFIFIFIFNELANRIYYIMLPILLRWNFFYSIFNIVICLDVLLYVMWYHVNWQILFHLLEETLTHLFYYFFIEQACKHDIMVSLNVHNKLSLVLLLRTLSQSFDVSQLDSSRDVVFIV